MEEVNEMLPGDEKRPKLLTIIGILSFVALGGQFIMLVFRFIRGKLTEEQLVEQEVQTAQLFKTLKLDGPELSDAMETASLVMKQENDGFWLLQFISIVTIALGLAGVLMMFKRNKIGFHLYIIYCLLGIGGSFLYLSPGLVTLPGLFLSMLIAGLFILLYAKNLKWMK